MAHLTERISGVGEDGQPRVFRDSAVENLCRVLRAVPRAERPVATTSSTPWWPRPSGRSGASAPSDLRDGEGLRREVAGQLSRVQASLDAMLVDRPRRRIIRQAAGPGGRRDAAGHRARRPGPGDLLARRSTWPPSAAPRSPAPATSSPTATGGGTPTSARCSARSSARSPAGARPWPPRSPGSNAHWLLPPG